MIAYSSNCLTSLGWLASIAEGDSVINATLNPAVQRSGKTWLQLVPSTMPSMIPAPVRSTLRHPHDFQHMYSSTNPYKYSFFFLTVHHWNLLPTLCRFHGFPLRLPWTPTLLNTIMLLTFKLPLALSLLPSFPTSTTHASM